MNDVYEWGLQHPSVFKHLGSTERRALQVVLNLKLQLGPVFLPLSDAVIKQGTRACMRGTVQVGVGVQGYA